MVKPMKYTEFMARELPKYKKANPKKSHIEAFTAVAGTWAKSEFNPKNATPAKK
jgi:hypothetical protein